MVDWKCKVDIKKIIDNDDLPDFSEGIDDDNQSSFDQVKNDVAKELRKCPDFTQKAGNDLVEMLRMSEDQEEFNDNLESIYDFADTRRIWLGL